MIHFHRDHLGRVHRQDDHRSLCGLPVSGMVEVRDFGEADECPKCWDKLYSAMGVVGMLVRRERKLRQPLAPV